MSHSFKVVANVTNDAGKEIFYVDIYPTTKEVLATADAVDWMLNTVFFLYKHLSYAPRIQGVIHHPDTRKLPWLYEYQRGPDDYSTQMRVVSMEETYAVSPVKATVIKPLFNKGDGKESTIVLVPTSGPTGINWVVSESTSLEHRHYPTTIFYVKDIKRKIRLLPEYIRPFATELFEQWTEIKLTTSNTLTFEESLEVDSVLTALEKGIQFEANRAVLFSALPRFVADPEALVKKYESMDWMAAAASNYVVWTDLAKAWLKKPSKQ